VTISVVFIGFNPVCQDIWPLVDCKATDVDLQ
jgi:hypothetical protein